MRIYSTDWHKVGGTKGSIAEVNDIAKTGGTGNGIQEESNGPEGEAEEKGIMGEERERLCREAEVKGEREESAESGGSSCWGKIFAFEADSRQWAKASEGVYADRGSVLCEDSEYEIHKVSDNAAAEGDVESERRCIAWSRSERRLCRERGESGNVQWRYERDKLPQDTGSEKDDRQERRDIFSGILQVLQSGRDGEESGSGEVQEESVHNGDRSGRAYAIERTPLRGFGRLANLCVVSGKAALFVGKRRAA